MEWMILPDCVRFGSVVKLKKHVRRIVGLLQEILHVWLMIPMVQVLQMLDGCTFQQTLYLHATLRVVNILKLRFLQLGISFGHLIALLGQEVVLFLDTNVTGNQH